ncbi:unnamed protein product [Protopolystoma xenopodis]|uniref:Uncharacterized protein n=1 Tax=Protopolystoma xenopodis TaxID=117903 RepID=A0A3S4ZUK0_9PLAT|nr:unnamed protein product [Protopolystoma xenopodis]
MSQPLARFHTPPYEALTNLGPCLATFESWLIEFQLHPFAQFPRHGLKEDISSCTRESTAMIIGVFTFFGHTRAAHSRKCLSLFPFRLGIVTSATSNGPLHCMTQAWLARREGTRHKLE